jgi:predicted enzyme related to lactoylglutathione lyase
MPTDPFNLLKRSYREARPDPRFAIALKTRLAEELNMTETATEASASPLGELRLVHLRATSADQAMAFFGSLFDWEAERVPYRGHVRHYTTNTTTTAVLLDDPAAPPASLCFESQQPAHLARQIQALGGEITEADGDRYAQCRDPQGVALVFFQPGGSHPHDPPTKIPAGEFAFAFLVEDAVRACPFFGALIGHDIVPAHPTSIYHDVVPGIGLIHAPDRTPQVIPYFQVNDLEAMRVRVRDLGGEPDEPGGMGPFVGCECVDDQGSRFGLCQLVG